jgi:hypothetical protein
MSRFSAGPSLGRAMDQEALYILSEMSAKHPCPVRYLPDLDSMSV